MKVPQKAGSSPWGVPPGSDLYGGSDDASLFSSSLPVLPHEKLIFQDSKNGGQSVDDASSREVQKDVEGKDPLDDLDLQGIGSRLPDDEDELLAGIMDDFDLSGLPNQVEALEDFDLFGSGGGMELDYDFTESLNVSMAKTSIVDDYIGSGSAQHTLPNGVGTIVGEHPYGEHPSRTLFVRNINSNVEDSELRSLFEQYGDIRTLYTACKHRGFVMISYYDIRAARTAMRALQNKPLRRRKLDIHFSIPKDNPSDKDINQGTLVAFNLDPSVLNDDLREIFGVYGEVKEIRETPHKRHHKFIEFYDVRAAEAALRSLNRSDIAGKRIKLEPSRPGGTRRNLMHHLGQDLDQDETRSYRHQLGSPITNSPPGVWAQYSSPSDNEQPISRSPTLGSANPLVNNHLPGLGSIVPPLTSNSLKIAPIGKDHDKISYVDQVFSNINGVSFQHSHSFPEHSRGMMPNMNQSPVTVSSLGHSATSSSGIGTLTGPQFLWGSPTSYSGDAHSTNWPAPSIGHAFTPSRKEQGFPSSDRHGSFLSSPLQQHHLHHQPHHVGSAPSGVPYERHFGFVPKSPETSFISSVNFGGMRLGHSERNLMTMGAPNSMNPGVSFSGSMFESGSPNFRIMPSTRMSHMFVGGSPFPTPGSSGTEVWNEHGVSRRFENNGSQLDSKKQFQLDLEKIVSGEDTRTTLMIKNIPNKYTSKMLMAAIDENHKGLYDFLYLPIDFKNKCNVGYAFINMVAASQIITFYQEFNGKKWEKFNSEKVASLAYARIQGKAALITHFQNSSLMNEDKRCRPILFHSEGMEAGDQELFPNSINVRLHQLDGSSMGIPHEGSSKTSQNEKVEKSGQMEAGQGKGSRLPQIG